MERQKCPKCNKQLPLFMFRADLKEKATNDYVLFKCSHCKSRLQAFSNEAHRKNFFWVLFTPILAVVVLISLHSIVPSYLRAPYYFLGVMLSLFYPVISGQHKMDIKALEDNA